MHNKCDCRINALQLFMLPIIEYRDNHGENPNDIHSDIEMLVRAGGILRDRMDAATIAEAIMKGLTWH